MSHTIYAAKFEQTIIHQHVHLRRESQAHAPVHVTHQHVHLRRESQSHAPEHVLMRLYPIDKSLVCLQSERRMSC